MQSPSRRGAMVRPSHLMGRIRLLSDELIDKIAAGEVVERPASVVKELAENSVDAGARNVRVTLTAGGLGSITVADDGQGMSPEDAALAMRRHATSKLRDEEGLFQIATKGFRGEALPSIASVSRFALLTSEPGATAGTRVTLEGGGELRVEEGPAPGGTRIEVQELFFNTPARRKFLKRESTELGHCEEAVIRLALAHPEVGFFVDHDGRRLFASPGAADAKERLVAALGPEVGPHLLAIEERRLGVTVGGFVASPEHTLPNARGLYTFVNRRYIRDRGLIAAVQRAFQESLPPGRQPVAVVAIELDPRAVDVNVHPQKLEVRFADPRSVQEAVISAISRALKAAPWRRSPSQPVEAEAGAHYAQAVERFLTRAQAAPAFFEPPPSLALDQRPAFGTARPGAGEAFPPGWFSALRYVGELARRFWLCEAPGGTLAVLDPRAVVERVRLQALLDRFRAGTLAGAPATLFSARVDLPAAQAKALLAAAAGLEALGVELEPFGQTSLAVKRVPAELEGADLQALLGELAGLDQLGAAALKVMASHASAQPRRSLSHDEIGALLGRLDEVDFGVSCLHGRVVVFELPLLDLEARAR